MAVPLTLLEQIVASLRVTRVDPPLTQIGQYVRFGFGPDPGLLRAVDPDLVMKNLGLTLGLGTLGPGSLTGDLPIPVEVPIALTVTWRAYRPARTIPGAFDLPSARPEGAAELAGAGAGVGGVRVGRATDRITRVLAAEEPDSAVTHAGSIEIGREDLVLGEDFLAPDGVSVPDVSFLFAPAVTDLAVESLPAVRTIYVYASVTLTAGSTSVSRDLPAVPVLVPVLAIPKLLVLFRYSDFNLETEGGLPRKRQALLLVVPSNAALGAVDDLQPVLRTLRSVLTPLRRIRRFARLLLGVQVLEGALARRPRLRFVIADRLNDLHKIKLITVTRWEDSWVNDQIPDVDIPDISLPGVSIPGGNVGGVSVPGVSVPGASIGGPTPGNNEDNDIYAGNRMSSLLFLAPPGESVECFLEKNCDDGKGRLVVTTGPEPIVMMRSLRIDPNDTAPDTTGGSAEADPSPNPPGDGFDDRISSLSF
jgi:hypothetical protein